MESKIRFQSLCHDVIASDLNNGCFLLSIKIYTYQSYETISVQSICMHAGVFAYLAVLLTTQVSLLSQCLSGSFSESNSSSTVETTLH